MSSKVRVVLSCAKSHRREALGSQGEQGELPEGGES